MNLEFFTLLMLLLYSNLQIAVTFLGINNDEALKLDIFSKCYADIGCIETDSRWYDEKIRPINLRPLDRHTIKTDFLLIRSNKTTGRVNATTDLLYNSIIPKSDSFPGSFLQKKTETIILIHDFTGNGYTGWIKHLSSEILFNNTKLKKINIISVDWQRGAEPPFDQAIANARVVALEIIALIKEIQEVFRIAPDEIQIIGHGVGAHIAGYVGSAVNNLKKITALDPTGSRFAGMPNLVKLNANCAKYVEVLHTDAFEARSQGTREEMGHSDFFINDAFQQPGCGDNSTFEELVKVERNHLTEGAILPGCSHKRAFKYFIETLYNKKCSFLGIKCESYEAYARGNCTSCGNVTKSRCKSFGINVLNHETKGTYFLHTAERKPYCLFLFTISVKVIVPGDFFGYFDFIFIDKDKKIANASISDSHSNFRDFKLESNNTFIYYSTPPKIGQIIEAKVQWNEKKKVYCFIYCKQAIGVGEIVVKNFGNEQGFQTILCPKDGVTDLENGVYTTFFPCKQNHQNQSKTTE